MGEVYLADDMQLGRKIALKVLLPDFTTNEDRMRRFEQEARAASALNHPNILTIHEIGEADAVHFMATEFVDGVTLHQHMSRTRMKISEVLDVAIQVASALSAAHAAGIVHRDIKPENIMLRPDGYVKILDFGLAKLTQRSFDDTEAPTMVNTEPGIVMGTVKYMSPEQARGLDVDARSDIWSLGVVIYMMVAGAAPFVGKTPTDVIVSILEREPVPLRQYRQTVPPELELIVKKALAKQKEKRYQAVNDLASDLKHLRQEMEFRARLERSAAPDTSGGATIGGSGGHETDADVSWQTNPTVLSVPPLESLDSRPHNLSIQLTSLIGREAEVAAVEKLLRQEEVRLLTLTGPGGTGKTRLGLQVASNLLSSFKDGVFFVALSTISDPSLLVSTIAQTLGIKEAGGVSLLQSLRQYLQDKQILLLLDNFEQLLGAAPVVADLLTASPHLKVLVTSRAVLHVQGEQEFPVPSLALPDLKHLPPAENLAQYGAVALFVRRARAAKPSFTMTNENAPAVAEICTRLDGLPLAIELAAARIKLLSPQAMLARLENRFKLLTGGAQDLPSRQQTMRGAIAWGYDLLAEDEKGLFRQLSIFVGGCTLEAVEAVCGGEGDLEIDVLSGVESLLDKSMLRQKEQADGEPRFTMLETIREYGLECLKERGETETLRRRHANFFLALAEGAEPELTGSRQVELLEQLETEHDNLRAALQWMEAGGEIELGLRLAGALWRFWDVHGYLSEGRKWLEGFLGRAQSSSIPASVRAKATNGAGVLAGTQGDFERQDVILQESLALYRELGDKLGVAQSLNNLGSIAYSRGDWERAAALYTESLSLRRELGDKWGIANSLNNLGGVAYSQGDYERAAALYAESLDLRRGLGDRRGIGMSLNNLGEVAQQQGDYERAAALYMESLDLRRELGDKLFIASSLSNLGEVACDQGDCERAAQLFGAAEALRETIGSPLPLAKRHEYERRVAAACDALGQESFAAAWAEGRAMTLEQAIAYALERNTNP